MAGYATFCFVGECRAYGAGGGIDQPYRRKTAADAVQLLNHD
jgi:hypothetical protein